MAVEAVQRLRAAQPNESQESIDKDVKKLLSKGQAVRKNVSSGIPAKDGNKVY